MKALLSSAVEIALTSFPKNDFARRNQLSQDVLLYIEEHLLDPSFSIYTISETFGLSESAFSHLFKRTFHRPIPPMSASRSSSAPSTSCATSPSHWRRWLFVWATAAAPISVACSRPR